MAQSESMARSETLDLSINGMTCAACSARIERVLNRMEGVSAAVNLATETARVTYPADTVTPQQIIEKIEKTGFQATPITAESKRPERRSQKGDVIVFLFSALFTLPLLLEMVAMFGGGHEPVIPLLWQWVLATPVQFVAGARFYRGAWKSLKGGGANMDVLIALGTTMAYGLSVAVILFDLHGQHVYFEASATVITLVLLGKVLEGRARRKTTEDIEALARLQPRSALVEDAQGQLRTLSIEQVAPGMVVVLRAGEAVPVDGTLIDGRLSIDESMLSGESLPIDKQADDAVYAASRILDGAGRCRAEGVGAQTQLSEIIRLVEAAQGSKAPIQQLADRISAVFVPAVCLIALGTFIISWLVGIDVGTALIRAVSVLVVACPCALGLATPTAVIAGIGAGARHGLLFRDAGVLEKVEKIRLMLLDKTGTLTAGKPAVDTVLSLSPALGERDVLRLSAALEVGSTHPLGRAVLARAEADGIAITPAADFRSLPGEGIEGVVEGRTLRLGAVQWTGGADRIPPELTEAGKTLSVLADETGPLGVIAIADPLRPESASAIRMLKEMGIRPVMASGDAPPVAARIAAETGIDEWKAGLKPQDKAALVTTLQKEAGPVAMVGDGINDAPALALADVGFAMRGGSEAAEQAADVTLMHDDPGALADAVSLSRATMRKIRQNLFFAFAYNCLALPFAALGFLHPALAGAAMAASSVSVVTNSLLLRRWKPVHRKGELL